MSALNVETIYPKAVPLKQTKDALRCLDPTCPEISTAVREFLDRPIEEYAGHLFQTKVEDRDAEANLAFEILAGELRKIGVTGETSVIQTANHCQLLLDAPSFYSTFLTWMGAKSAGLRNYVVFNSIAVTLETRARSGPGWVPATGSSLPLFNVSRRTLERTSVMGLANPSFNAETIDILSDLGIELPWREIEAMPMASAENLITSANLGLHSKWSPNGPGVVFINDRFISNLLIEHIKHRTLVYDILFEPDRRHALLKNLSEHRGRPHGGSLIPKSTELFWALDKGRIQPLSVLGSRIMSNKINFDVIIDPVSIVELLESGEIIPDLFVLFIILSFLPRVKVLGGLRQIGYIPMLQKVFLDSLDLSDPSENQIFDALNGHPLHGWTMRAIDLPISVLELSKTLGNMELFSNFAGKLSRSTLRDLSGGLSRMSVHPAWQFARSSLCA